MRCRIKPRKLSEESDAGDLKSIVVDPHDLVSSNGFLVKYDKHVLYNVKLIVTWLYEDPNVGEFQLADNFIF